MWKDSNFIGHLTFKSRCNSLHTHRNKLFHSHVALKQRQQLVSANEERYVANGYACALHVCVLSGVWSTCLIASTPVPHQQAILVIQYVLPFMECRKKAITLLATSSDSQLKNELEMYLLHWHFSQNIKQKMSRYS